MPASLHFRFSWFRAVKLRHPDKAFHAPVLMFKLYAKLAFFHQKRAMFYKKKLHGEPFGRKEDEGKKQDLRRAYADNGGKRSLNAQRKHL